MITPTLILMVAVAQSDAPVLSHVHVLGEDGKALADAVAILKYAGVEYPFDSTDKNGIGKGPVPKAVLQYIGTLEFTIIHGRSEATAFVERKPGANLHDGFAVQFIPRAVQFMPKAVQRIPTTVGRIVCETTQRTTVCDPVTPCLAPQAVCQSPQPIVTWYVPWVGYYECTGISGVQSSTTPVYYYVSPDCPLFIQ
jgi:hypothetical protein